MNKTQVNHVETISKVEIETRSISDDVGDGDHDIVK